MVFKSGNIVVALVAALLRRRSPIAPACGCVELARRRAGAAGRSSLGDDPYAGGQHRGIDIGAPTGAEVRAPRRAWSPSPGRCRAQGLCLTIRTADGYSVTLVHLGSIGVPVGTAVGGGRGRRHDRARAASPKAAEPYVHLGIRLTADPNGYLDPLSLLPARQTAPPPPPARAGRRAGRDPPAPPAVGAPRRVSAEAGAARRPVRARSARRAAAFGRRPVALDAERVALGRASVSLRRRGVPRRDDASDATAAPLAPRTPAERPVAPASRASGPESPSRRAAAPAARRPSDSGAPRGPEDGSARPASTRSPRGFSPRRSRPVLVALVVLAFAALAFRPHACAADAGSRPYH